MSDTPTSVSLSKTPAAQARTDYQYTKAGCTYLDVRTRVRAYTRRTCTYTGDTRERDGRISSDFSTPDREARCYVKLGEKAGIYPSWPPFFIRIFNAAV